MFRPKLALLESEYSATYALRYAVERCDADYKILSESTLYSKALNFDEIGALIIGDVPFNMNSDGSRNDILGNTYDDSVVSLEKRALTLDLPILAIGRGLELLNIVFGGKASVGISDHSSVEEESAIHQIYISPGSKLAAVVGSGGFVRVNSRHELGIREAQKSQLLLASAYSLEDGVIEALESPAHKWVIGVQFRPDLSMELPPHFQRLFQSLVERSTEYMRGVKTE